MYQSWSRNMYLFIAVWTNSTNYIRSNIKVRIQSIKQSHFTNFKNVDLGKDMCTSVRPPLTPLYCICFGTTLSAYPFVNDVQTKFYIFLRLGFYNNFWLRKLTFTEYILSVFTTACFRRVVIEIYRIPKAHILEQRDEGLSTL